MKSRKLFFSLLSFFFFFIILMGCNETTSDNDGKAEHSEHEHNGMESDHVDREDTEGN